MVKYYNGEMYIIPDEFEEEIRAGERKKVIEEYDSMFRELSNIKSHCGEWYEKTEQKIRESVLNEAIEKVDEYWLDDAYFVSCIKDDLEQLKGEQTDGQIVHGSHQRPVRAADCCCRFCG